MPQQQQLKRRMSEGAAGKRRLRDMFADQARRAFAIPPHAQFGSPSLLSTSDFSISGISTQDLALHLPQRAPNLSSVSLHAARSSISIDSTLTQMSHPNKASSSNTPVAFFPPDAYYFANNTNPSSSRRKRPSTSASTSTVSTDPASSTPALTRAASAGKSSSFTRPTSAGNDSQRSQTITPLSSPPKLKKRTATAISGVGSTTPSIDLATPSALGAPTHSEPAPENTESPKPSLSLSQTPMVHPNAFVTKNGKRYHSTDAPYPRSYDTTAIDHDTATHIFFTTLCQSLTWHEFSTPPANVLDLGCGNGVWILDAAKQWPNSQFVGLDLVPLQPNLKLVAPQLANRIRWVTANFLEKLDFPDNHFDFVHIRRIARGVPENKWPLLLEEVSRVLKPDGAIEVIEEDLIFPGGQEPCTCHHPPDKIEATYHSSSHGHGPETTLDNLISQDDIRHSPPETPVPMLVSGDDLYQHPSHYYSSPLVNARDHSRLEQAYNDMHSAKFINLMPISVLTSILAQYFKDVRSHPPLLITFPPPEEEMWSDSSEESAVSSSNEGNGDGDKTVRSLRSRPSTTNSTIRSMGSSAVASSATGSPTTPHQLLSPAFSPISTTSNNDGSLFSLSSESIDDSTSAFMDQPPAGGWHTLHLDVRSLVHPKQPFVMIDRCRMPARTFGSSTNILPNGSPSMSRLPNTTFELDLQSLTLHLSQSVTEVLECREAIWDFLVEQKRARIKKANGTTTSSGASIKTFNSLSMVDREEFDHWIVKYEREMHERIGLASALRKRFNWKTKGLSSSDIRGVGGKKRKVASRFANPGSTNSQSIMAPLAGGGHGTLNHSSSELLTSGGEPHGDEYPYSSSSTSLPVDETATGSGNTATGSTVTRQRTGSAPERVSALTSTGQGGVDEHGYHHHSRAHSLDAANAWEEILNSRTGTTTGIGGQGQEDEEEEELPRLSRCVRVFVAWNNKTSDGGA